MTNVYNPMDKHLANSPCAVVWADATHDVVFYDNYKNCCEWLQNQGERWSWFDIRDWNPATGKLGRIKSFVLK